MRKLCVTFFVCLLAASLGTVPAQDSDVLAYVSGGSSKQLFKIVESDPDPVAVEIYSAKKGFRPEGISRDSSGRLFICDTSNSQIHIAEEDGDGVWHVKTIHDRDSADSPTLEQPVGCTIVHPDLFVGERGGAGSTHGVWVIRDAAVTPTNDPFTAPELLVSFAGMNEKAADIAIAPDGSVLMTLGNQILVAESPDYLAFEPLIIDLAADATGIAVSSTLEVFVAMGTLGIIEAFELVGDPPVGSSCGTYVDVSPLRPNHLEFNLADVLHFTAPQHANGNGGQTYFADPPEGSATPQCVDGVVSQVTALPLTDPNLAPDGNFGIALTGSSVSQERFFGGGPETIKQCSADFIVDPQDVGDDCNVTFTCRDMPFEEFEARTEDNFPNTLCMPFPAVDCREIVATGAQCFDGVTHISYNFFASEPVSVEDCPGLLYTDCLSPDDSYDSNIATGFDPEPVPNDPGLRAQKLDFGSCVVATINNDNRPPVAYAGEDETVDCTGSTVTIDGSASSDPDPIDQERGLSFEWTSPTGSHIPDGFETAAMFNVDVADLFPGANVYKLTVTDSGFCPGVVGVDTGTVTITVDPDVTAPTINSITPDPALLWPPNHEMIPVTLTVDATDECGDVFCRIVDVVHSDVPESGNGANTIPDWEFDGEPVLAPGALNLVLRSERNEGSTSVDDTRTYTITVRCEDEVGNFAPDAAAEVLVFSDQGN